MNSNYKIEVIHDDSGKVVRTFEYNSKRQREKAYEGLIRQINLGEYTAVLVPPTNT